jgi:hypothetical protein
VGLPFLSSLVEAYFFSAFERWSKSGVVAMKTMSVLL